MATLGRALIAHYPQYYQYFSTVNFRYNNRTFRNHNRLLTAYEGTDGIKTGYIHAVGYNLVASAMRGDRRLVGVVLGGRTGRQRDRQMAEMFDRSFAGQGEPLVASAPLPLAKPTTFPPVDAAGAGAQALAAPKAPPQPQGIATPAAVTASAPVLAPPHPREALSEGAEWSVQVGAFSRYAQAHLAVSRATKALPELLSNPVSIQRDEASRNNLYRARIVGMTESDARKSCRTLRRKKLDCLALPHGPYGEERGEGSE
jgi:D-alanyl-D-alanine carboxypeptidase